MRYHNILSIWKILEFSRVQRLLTNGRSICILYFQTHFSSSHILMDFLIHFRLQINKRITNQIYRCFLKSSTSPKHTCHVIQKADLKKNISNTTHNLSHFPSSRDNRVTLTWLSVSTQTLGEKRFRRARLWQEERIRDSTMFVFNNYHVFQPAEMSIHSRFFTKLRRTEWN